MKLVDITHHQAHKLYYARLINTRQFIRLAARIQFNLSRIKGY
ncbi:hypothetical protein ACEV85_09805 [Vibrio parahaemolyticus]|nr:hypothetical protein [Vibrio sp. Vb2535]MDW1754563.1 hypothetical protein [Vibrio sp. Vb2535]